jgi:hypothetical protein
LTAASDVSKQAEQLSGEVNTFVAKIKEPILVCAWRTGSPPKLIVCSCRCVLMRGSHA